MTASSVRVVVLAFALLAMGSTHPALGADSRAEAAAANAMKKAEGDYAAGAYGKAATRLRKAIGVCLGGRCPKETVAALLRDFGVMQLRMKNRRGAAVSWAAAIKMAPDLDLNPDYDEPDVRDAWDRTTGGRSTPTPTATATATATATPTATATATATATPTATPTPTPISAPPPADRADANRPPQSPAEPTKPPPMRRLWIGFAGSLEFMRMPQVDEACRGDPASGRPANLADLYCTRATGADFPDRAPSIENGQLVPGHAGQSDARVRLGDVRAMVAVDVALMDNLLFGARVGMVLRHYPGHAAVNDGLAFGIPLHLEARITYVAGSGPLPRRGLAFTTFVAGGLSEFDAHEPSTAWLRQGGHLTARQVSVWQTSGPWFAALGTGLRWAASDRLADTLVVRANASFGPRGVIPTIGPELSIQYGF
jgi:hypothetical protein